MGLSKPYNVNTSLHISNNLYKKRGDTYLRAGDNYHIVETVSSILSIPLSEREAYKQYFVKELNEIFQFVGGVTDSNLSHVPEEHVNNHIISSGNSLLITVGDTLTHRIIELNYVLTKPTAYESGIIKVTNLVDTVIYRNSQFDDAGIIISKSIVNNDINLLFNDSLDTGDDINMQLSTKIYSLEQ